MSVPLSQSGGSGGSSLATPVSLANGGTHADLSATGGASQVLKQSSVGADITVGQLGFTNLSGFATAAQAGLGVASPFGAAGTGWLFAYAGMTVPPMTTTTVGFFAANQPLAYATLLPSPMTVRKLTVRVSTGVAATKCYVAIYDASGNKVSGSDFPFIDASASTTTRTVTLGASIDLPAGMYYIAIAQDTAGVVMVGIGGYSDVTNQAVLNTNVGRMVTGANNLSAGVMPSALGVLTNRTGGLQFILLES